MIAQHGLSYIGQSLLEFYRDHLIPNIWTHPLIRLTEKCIDAVTTNGPKLKIAVSPNYYTTLSSENGYGALCNFLFWDFCMTIVTAFTFCRSIGSHEVSTCWELNGL